MRRLSGVALAIVTNSVLPADWHGGSIVQIPPLLPIGPRRLALSSLLGVRELRIYAHLTVTCINRQLIYLLTGYNNYPRGWVYLKSAQKYYRAIFELMDWSKAKVRCHELGPYSRLVDINDPMENMAVKEFIASFDGLYCTWLFLCLGKLRQRRRGYRRCNHQTS